MVNEFLSQQPITRREANKIQTHKGHETAADLTGWERENSYVRNEVHHFMKSMIGGKATGLGVKNTDHILQQLNSYMNLAKLLNLTFPFRK